ncbi:MAG: amidohydrolase [Planctomycetaceae bacterium]|nr:amidohydrolase [Planctomycetaceae bacterium]
MIDMHIHAVNPQLPGVRHIPDFLSGPLEPLVAILRQQMQESGTEAMLGMGHLGGTADDPLGIASTLRIAELLPVLHPIGVADPTRIDTEHLQRVERQLQSGKVKALKGYLGYLYYGPDSPAYVPYYELAARYKLPFIFHTGDNYSDLAKVKYAHPLLVDEVAVDHRGVNFVMAHFGNPWITDAAEVLYKNENVWADLSGLLVGDDAYFANMTERGVVRRVVERVKQGIEFTERPDKFLYGTDWPLAPMRTYRDFVRELIPENYHQAVFHDNAKALFKM